MLTDREMLESVARPLVAADDRIRELVPFESPPFDVAARDALS